MSEQQANVWEKVLRGTCQSDDLPEVLDLSDLAEAMNRLWRRSVRQIRKGQVTEYGATIVLQRDRLRLTHVVAGTSDDVTPLAQPGRGQVFVGTFHTHPYSTGETGVAFSGTDIASAINDRESVSVVQSGDIVFALVRTECTPASVGDKIIELKMDLLMERYSEQDTPFAEAVQSANLALCAWYGLAFYRGGTEGLLEVIFQP
jgi:hypothetical protein